MPAFIGYTETGPADTAVPMVARVATMLEFETTFGGPQLVGFTVTEAADPAAPLAVTLVKPTNPFSLYYGLSHYFRNGGGPCYVVSVGTYGSAPSKARFSAGLTAIEKHDEPTLMVLTDAASLLSAADYYTLCGEALQQCRNLGDRFTIVDVLKGDVPAFRNDANLAANLMYGAAYHPFLQTSIAYLYNEGDVRITRTAAPDAATTRTLPLGDANGINVTFTGPAAATPTVAIIAGTPAGPLGFAVAGATLTIGNANSKTGSDIADAWTTWAGANPTGGFAITRTGDGSAVVATQDVAATPMTAPASNAAETLANLRLGSTALYNRTKATLADQRVTLPPSAAMAGIYARVDRERGVWKAPANVGVLAVTRAGYQGHQ